MKLVSLSEISALISSVNQSRQFDLGKYESITLRLKVTKLLSQYRLLNTDSLLERLERDNTFFEEFLYQLSVETTSMFRDPEHWIILKNELLADLARIFN